MSSRASSSPKTFPKRDDWHVAAWVAVRILNVDSGRCDPSVPKLATGSGISERSVHRPLASLERKGWIAIQRASGRCNEYVLLTPDTAMAGDRAATPDSGGNGPLPNPAQTPATCWQSNRGTAKRTAPAALDPRLEEPAALLRKPLALTTAEELTAWRNGLVRAKSLAPSTINRIMNPLRVTCPDRAHVWRGRLLGKTKEHSGQCAIELVPSAHSALSLKKNHNAAEALLIADVGARLLTNTKPETPAGRAVGAP